jgi:hypothetical protein
MKCDSRASLLACTFVSLYLGHEPKARVATHLDKGQKDHKDCGWLSHREGTLQLYINIKYGNFLFVLKTNV